MSDNLTAKKFQSDCIKVASINPKRIYKNLSLILDTADIGTVITKDHTFSILIKLSEEKKYSDNCLVLLRTPNFQTPNPELKTLNFQPNNWKPEWKFHVR